MTTPYRPFAARLAARATVGASFVRLTLAGDLGDVSATLLDQRIKLIFGPPNALAGMMAAGRAWYERWAALPDDARPAVRTYTLSAVRPAAGEVDVDVVVHGSGVGSGPGTQFATAAPIGTQVVLVAGDRTLPGHDQVGLAWRPTGARDLLIVGDETALPAIANIAATLPADARGRIVVEVPHEEDVRDLTTPPAVEVAWCPRDRGHRAHQALPFPVTDHPDTEAPGDVLWHEAEIGAGTDGEGRYCWVAGEAGWVNRIRAGAKQAGLPRRQMAFMGYWRAETPGG